MVRTSAESNPFIAITFTSFKTVQVLVQVYNPLVANVEQLSLETKIQHPALLPDNLLRPNAGVAGPWGLGVWHTVPGVMESLYGDRCEGWRGMFAFEGWESESGMRGMGISTSRVMGLPTACVGRLGRFSLIVRGERV
jgi:hypothetical protein